MQYALSRRYHGIVINAGDPEITYGSYKHLGLYCPFCKSPVFFVGLSKRKAHQRQTGKGKSVVKASSVQPHFTHFGEGDDAYPSCCEIRSKRIKRREIVHLNGQARDQRLKHLWVHFERLIAMSMSPGGIIIGTTADYQKACIQAFKSPDYVVLITTKVEEDLRSRTGEFKKKCSTFLERLIERVKKPNGTVSLALSDPEFFDFPPKELSNMDAWLLQLVPEAQKILIEEAIDFLLFRRNQLLLEKLIICNFYTVIQVLSRTKKGSFEFPISFFVEEIENSFMTALALCRWAENFEQLEVLEKTKV